MKRLTLLVLILTAALHADTASIFYIKTPADAAGAFHENKSHFKIFSADPEFTLPETASQKVLSARIDKNTTMLSIETGKNNITLTDEKELRRSLEDTALLTYSIPEIKKISDTIKHDNDPVKAAALFVNRYITNKMMGIPIAGAKAVLASRSGDCTEHAVLCTSILRGAGIPARVVVGVILSPPQPGNGFFPDDEYLFIYHMWCEALVNARWQTVDATRPLNVKENLYLAFAYHNLRTEAPLSYLEALSKIKEMKINYIK